MTSGTRILEKDFFLFETILWKKDLFEKTGSGLWLMDLHKERLFSSAKSLGFKVEQKDFERTIKKLELELLSKGQENYRVKLVLKRDGSFLTEYHPFNRDAVKEPVLIDISPHRVDPSNPFLYHKTSKRALFDQERKRLEDKGLFETIFLNKKGEVTQGSITNIFIQDERERLFTPPVSSGLLPGVLREYLLKKGKVRERPISPDDLKGTKRIYVGNSLRGLLEARLTR